MSDFNRPEVKKVLQRAQSLQIPLRRFIDCITETYIDGGVQGFKFVPKNYSSLQNVIAAAIKKMVLFNDDYTDSVGAIMGSDARKHGYAVSARERNLINSLHIELSKQKCDVHLDSHSITTGHIGFPFWGGHYDPTRFIGHGIKDLAPSYLHGTWASFLSPALARLDLDLSLNARAAETGQREAAFLNSNITAPYKERLRVGFSVTFKFY